MWLTYKRNACLVWKLISLSKVESNTLDYDFQQMYPTTFNGVKKKSPKPDKFIPLLTISPNNYRCCWSNKLKVNYLESGGNTL